MNKYLPNIISVFLVALLIGGASWFGYQTSGTLGSSAASIPSPSITVSGQVGSYYLNASGYISPHASVVLIIDGIFYRSTVAGADGRFSFKDVLIKLGLSRICFEAKDFHNLGDSYSCIDIPPAKGNVTKENIFLPPTLALQRSEIAAGGNTLAFGYTMPGAKVTLHVGDKLYTTIAGGDGYYEIMLENIPAGTYLLFADANYNGNQSIAPSRFLKLKALTLWQQIIAWLIAIWKWFMTLLTSVGLGPLWIGLPLLVIITTLILRTWPERFTWIYNSRVVIFFSKKNKRLLHHAWFVGY